MYSKFKTKTAVITLLSFTYSAPISCKYFDQGCDPDHIEDQLNLQCKSIQLNQPFNDEYIDLKKFQTQSFKCPFLY